MVLACLLILPTIVLRSLHVDFILAVGYLGWIGALSYVLYWVDKRRAIANAWRIPENVLHLTELLGGWPGAFLAQRRFRHKISKSSYQFMFWIIVLAHQFAAFDSLQEWKFSRNTLSYIQAFSQVK